MVIFVCCFVINISFFFSEILFNQQEVHFYCCNQRILAQVLNVNMTVLRWINMCISADLSNKVLKLTVDGVITTMPLRDLGYTSQPLKIRSGGVLIIGQDQDSVGGGMNPTESFAGYFSDFFLTEKVLSDTDAVKITTCKKFKLPYNLILDLKTIKETFILRNQTEVVPVKIEDTCKVVNKQYIIFTEERNFRDSDKLCNVFSGKLPTPKNEIENDFLLNKYPIFSQICQKLSDCRFWLGYKYNKNKDIVEHYETQNPPTFTNWLGPVIAIGNESCAVAWIGQEDESQDKNWRSMSCDVKFYSVCYFDEKPQLITRGLCKESLFDRKYTLYGYENKKPVFHGISNTRIVWVNSNEDLLIQGTWKMEINGNPNTYNIMIMETSTDYPMGVRKWKTFGDNCKDGDIVELMLTNCGKNMFTCGDGTCIDMEQRCNLVEDCIDQSDEFDCGVLIVPEGYDIRFSPPKPSILEPIPVKTNVTIYAVRGVLLIDNEILMELGFQRQWYDSQVYLKNLKNQTSQNIINNLHERIWYPSVDFYGENYCLAVGNTKFDIAWADKVTLPIEDPGVTLRPGNYFKTFSIFQNNIEHHI